MMVTKLKQTNHREFSILALNRHPIKIQKKHSFFISLRIGYSVWIFLKLKVFNPLYLVLLCHLWSLKRIIQFYQN